MRLALFHSEYDANPSPVEVTWERLGTALLTPDETDCAPCKGRDCPSKKGSAWSPVDYPDGAKRQNENVRAITCAVFDLEKPDHGPLPPETMQALARRLAGARYYCHSTHSPGCYRLVLALSRPLSPSEWARAYAGILARYQIPAEAHSDPARLYFMPRVARGNPWIGCEGKGEPLDVDALLRAPAPRLGPIDTTPLFRLVNAVPEKIDVGGPRDALTHVRGKSSSLAKQILSGQALAQPGARDTTVHAAASLISTLLPRPSVDQALGLLTPGILAMQCEPEGRDYWLEKARNSYTRKLADRTKEDEQRIQDREVMLACLGRASSPSVPSGDWRDLLIPNIIDGEIKGIKACEENIALIMQHDEDFGVLKFNDVTKEIDVESGPLKDAHPSTYEVAACRWFQQSMYKIFMHPFGFGPVMLAVARTRTYDPLADYLNGLKWDGEGRIDTFLTHYLGSADNSLTRLISRKWLIGAVARGICPGCKMDNVLLLEGVYGSFKSQAVEVLGGQWYSKIGKHSLTDKDTKLAASRFWLIEMDELAGLRSADAETVKSFFSTATDSFRPPYGRVVEQYKRRSVLVGTTNESRYLPEPNRREWPIVCDQIDLPGLKRDLDQIWAEAVVAYKAGENWWLDSENQKQAMEVANTRRAENPSESIVSNWWRSLPPSKRPRTMTSLDVAYQALNMTSAQISGRTLRDIGYAMKQLGFAHKRRRIGIAYEWYYEATDELIGGPVAVVKVPTPIDFVSAAKGKKSGT